MLFINAQKEGTYLLAAKAGGDLFWEVPGLPFCLPMVASRDKGRSPFLSISFIISALRVRHAFFICTVKVRTVSLCQVGIVGRDKVHLSLYFPLCQVPMSGLALIRTADSFQVRVHQHARCWHVLHCARQCPQHIRSAESSCSNVDAQQILEICPVITLL